MTVRWFLAKVISIKPPSGFTQYMTTFSRLVFEDWKYTDEDGVEHTIRMPAAKYPFPKSFAYNEPNPPYTVALVRAEVPDGFVIETGDMVQEATTQAHWRWLANNYPNLVGRFADQPSVT